MNRALLIAAFICLNCFPALSVNAVPAKLMAMGVLLLLVDYKQKEEL